MVSLIIQNEFIENLFVCDKSDYMKDFILFLKDDFFGYDLICDFANTEEYVKACEENPLWELIIDKINNVRFKEDLKYELKNPEFYNTFGEHNIFLTIESEISCENYMLQTGYIFLCLENIEEIWPKFKNCRNGYQFKVTNSNLIPEEQRLNSWGKLDNFFTPLNSVIIFDKYILGNKTDQFLNDNLYPLLYNLTSKNPTLKPLKITIISELDRDTSIQKVHEDIVYYLNQKGINNLEISIVKHHKSFYPKNFEGLHSRFILTNYFHFKCDDSFNFFKKNRKVNNDADLRINFNLVKNNNPFFKKELKDIRKYFSKISNNPLHPNVEHQEMYYPDKTNPLIHY